MKLPSRKLKLLKCFNETTEGRGRRQMFLGKESTLRLFLTGPDRSTSEGLVVVPSDGSSHLSGSPWHLPAKKNKYAKVLQKKAYPEEWCWVAGCCPLAMAAPAPAVAGAQPGWGGVPTPGPALCGAFFPNLFFS